MAVVVEPQKPQAPPSPDAGVIRDAHARQTRRRRRIAGVLIALGVLGALIGGLLEGQGSKSTGHSRAQRLAFERAKQRRSARGWYISPALEGGSYGWAVMEAQGAGCCTLPRPNSSGVTIGAIAGWTGNNYEEAATALLSDRVKAIVVSGQYAQLQTMAQLPYGLRMVKIVFPRHARHLFGEGAPGVLALDANAHPIGYIRPAEGTPETAVHWWEKPERLPAGPCQIHAQGVPGLMGEWGHVATAIRPYPARITGRAFFSCIDTEYYLHNWPLETAILLDAQHPGRRPAPIPDMKAIPGAHGLYGSPGDWHGEITAARHGNWWLVVAGGSGLRQREEVLAHLHASVSL